MKNVLGWIKTHLVIVICTIVIPASLVSGWVFSSGWNEKIRTGQAQRANNAHNKIKGAKVTYVIPSLLPGEQAWSESRAPNAAFTEFVKLERQKRLGSASGIVGVVESFNRRDHGLLEPALLPAPGNPQQETRLKYSMLAQVAGDEQLGEKSIYLDLFASIGAGDPPDPLKLATSLQDLRDRETDRTMDESGAASLTVEQQEVLDKLLSDRRIAEAQRRAKEISVYASLASFDDMGYADTTAQIPPISRNDRGSNIAPTLNEAFGWNFDYWVVSDLLAAIDRANTDAGGTRANVEHAAVKRIERLSVEALPVTPTGNPNAMPGDEPDEMTLAEGTDPSVSITGRVTTSQFDVVRAKMTLVVDAQALPRLFEAFADTNLMTILDLDVTEVDIWDDLRLGYYYGDGAVVRVDVEIETIWLRDWTTPMMPESVKEALGVRADDEFDDEG